MVPVRSFQWSNSLGLDPSKRKLIESAEAFSMLNAISASAARTRRSKILLELPLSEKAKADSVRAETHAKSRARRFAVSQRGDEVGEFV